jgi:transposase
MIGRKSKQLCMVILDMEDLIPQDHLLRRIKTKIDFDFIYKEAEDYYSKIGRPSIDPVCLIKMLLIGFLYGVKSERRLEEEVTLNIAYRWFCGFDLMDTIPDHSTFSQNRRRRFSDSTIFRQIFNQIVSDCIETGLVSGEAAVSDGSFIPDNV